MNKEETLAWFKGKKEGLRLAKEEIRMCRNHVEEWMKIINEEIKEREG